MRIALAVALLALIAVLLVVISNTKSGCQRAGEAYCRGSKDRECYQLMFTKCAESR